MANEIQAQASPNKTLYAIVVALSTGTPGQFYNASTPGFETFNAAHWIAGDYPIAMSELGGAGASGIYTGTFPVVAEGQYSVLVYQEASAGTISIANDALVAAGTIQWSGTRVVYPASPDSLGRVTTTYPLHKDVAYNNFQFYMSLTAGGPATGKTPAVTISLDAAGFNTATNSPATEIGNGWYFINFTAADINGTDIAIEATAAGCNNLAIKLPMQG